MNPKHPRGRPQSPSLSASRNSLRLFFFLALLALMAAGLRAQTLQFSLGFDDSGTTTTNSSGAAGNFFLNMVGQTGAATDAHGAIGSGLNGTEALDYSAHLFQGTGGNAFLTYVTNSPNLGFGAVSNFTAALWFKIPSPTGGGSARIMILGSNGIVDGAANAFNIQFQAANQLQIGINGTGNNVTFFNGVTNSFPIESWQFVAVTYSFQGTGVSTNLTVYWGDATHGPLLQTNFSPAVGGNINYGTSGSLLIGNNNARTRGYSGWMDNVQFYTGAGSATFVSNIWQQTLPFPSIAASATAGADVGSNAAVTISVPKSATAAGSLTLSFTSDNTAVIANTSFVLPMGVTSTNVNLPVLAPGIANVVVSAPNLGSAGTRVAGLDESGLVNLWVGDDYISGNNWTDRVSQVAAAINGNSQAVAISGAFGSHAGVSELNNASTVTGNGFSIPQGTAFGGTPNVPVTNITIAVAFKPTAAAAAQSGYYNDANILGYDIGGAGQQDFGIGWGGNDGANGGDEIDCGIGRTGGDTRMLSPNGFPLGLNVTHTAVMQINNANGTSKLFVDGLQVAGGEALTFFAINTNHAIPVLSTMYGVAPYGALPGSIAEIRFYTNALVDAAGLGAYLKSTYAGVLPISLAASPVATDPGSNVTVTVTIPSSASQTGPFVVTLTSDNTSVLASTNLTVPTGVTTTNVVLQILSSGTANLTASGSGVGSGTIAIIGLAPRAILEVFRANSLTNQISGINDGDPIPQWNGDSNSTPAFAGTASPTFHTNATLAGTPSVKFDKTQLENLGVPIGNNPINGMTNFSVVAVVKANSAGVGSGTAWYAMTGIADSEVGGNTYDWGVELDANGNLNFGTGVPSNINGDVNDSLAATNYTIVDSLFHVVVCSFDQLNGVKTITLDDKATETQNNPHFSPGNIQRVPGALTFGENKYGNYLDGEIVELRFFNGALTTTEAESVIAELKGDYNLIWPDQSAITIMPSPAAAEVGLTVNTTIGIPLGFNNASPVTVTVTSAPPGIVTFAGGSTTNVVFAAGTTNIKSIAVQITSAGSAVVNASAVGLVAGNATISGLAVPTVFEKFLSSDLPTQNPGIADGAPVSTWLGSLNSTPATATTVAPLFHANATPSGAPSVQFLATSNAFLSIAPASDPAAGLTNFSVAAVFKAMAVASSTSGNWWDMAGLLDDEESGTPGDWGLEVDSLGEAVFGTGSANGQVNAAGYNTVGAFHVVVASYDSLNGIEAIRIDNEPPVIETGLIGSPRIAGTLPLNIGANQYGDFFNGEIVELRIYTGALNTNEMSSEITSLKTNYSLSFPDDLTSVSLTATHVSPGTIQISWPSGATAQGYNLESSTNLSGGWSASGLSIGTVGGNSVVTDSTTNRVQFYRLRHP